MNDPNGLAQFRGKYHVFTSGCQMLFHRGVNNGDIAFK